MLIDLFLGYPIKSCYHFDQLMCHCSQYCCLQLLPVVVLVSAALVAVVVVLFEFELEFNLNWWCHSP